MRRILGSISRSNLAASSFPSRTRLNRFVRPLSTEAAPHPHQPSASTAPQTSHAFSTHSVPVQSNSISNMFDSPPTATAPSPAERKPPSADVKASAVSPGASARSERFKYVTHPFFARLRRVDTLSDQQRILIFLAAHTARGNLAAIARDWSFLEEENHAAGLEVIIQNIAYAGVPRVLNALNTVMDLGISNRVVVDNNPTTMEDRIKFRTMGEAEMHRIYGDKYQQYRARLAALHPALDNWMTEVTYGRIRGRPGLDRKTRQLCVLMAMAGGDVSFPQFRSMIIGALNTGATVEEVRGVLEATELIWGLQSQAVIDALWADLNKKKLQSIYERAREAEKKGVEGFSADSSHHTPTLEKMQFKAADDQPWNGAILPHYGGMFTAEEMRARATLNLLSQFRHVKDLSPHVRLLCLLSAQTASGNLTQVAKVWSLLEPRHHRMGMEAVLLSGTFSGFQRVVNALETIHTSSGVDPSAMAPFAPEQARNSDPLKVRQTGIELFDKIYRKQSPGLRAKMARIHPDVENIIIEFIYGRILARECDGMEPLHRELCSVACMAGQIVFPQLHSHLLGALNCGATLDQIRGILDQTQHVWGRNNQAMVDGFWLDFVRHASKP